MHVAGGVIVAMGGGSPWEVLLLGAYAALWLWGFVVVAIVLDARTRNEHLILANLGVSQRRVAVLATLQCAVMELVARLVATGALGAARPGG